VYRRKQQRGAEESPSPPHRTCGLDKIRPKWAPLPVGQSCDLPETEQVRVCSYQSQVKNERRCSQKSIGRIALWKGKFAGGRNDLVRQHSFPERKCRLSHPAIDIIIEKNAALLVERDRFPSADRRQPEFVRGIPHLREHSSAKAMNVFKAPQPDVSVE